MCNKGLCLLCARVGETDLALEQLEAVTKIPGGPKLWRVALGSDVGCFTRQSALRKIVASALKETVSK
jgi:hypothetical protein